MWSAAAFGLEISADFPAPGLEERESGGPSAAERPAALRLLAREGLDRFWAGETVQTLYDRALGGSRLAVLRDGSGAYLVHHDHYGRFRVTADGTDVACAPRDLPDWQWQRFLVGQVLPLAALQQGLEPLHASAVEVEGRALLCLGTSGAGKTSTALHMVHAGAELLTDDVTATEVRDGEVLAHPGAALASIDPVELERLEQKGSAIGPRLGVQDGEVRLLVERRSEVPAPVGGIYVLVRSDEFQALSVNPLPESRTAVLLGATFNAYAQHRDRLLVQLDVCARLADTVPMWLVEVPPGARAALVADAILDGFAG